MTLQEINRVEDAEIAKWLASEEEKENVRACWEFQHALVYLYGDPCFMDPEDNDRLMDKWVLYINKMFKTNCQSVKQASYVFNTWKYKTQVSYVYNILRSRGIDRFISPKSLKMTKSDMENVLKEIARIIEL